MADWSRVEVEAAVADYLDMLALEIRGEAFNKAEHNRNLRMMLKDRSAGSVEKKHQNISFKTVQDSASRKVRQVTQRFKTRIVPWSEMGH